MFYRRTFFFETWKNVIFSYETVSLVEGLNGSPTPIPTVTDPVNPTVNSSTRRKRHSSSKSSNGKSMHQVLTMEQLGDEEVKECIEMSYIANEHDTDEDDEDEKKRVSEKDVPISQVESEDGSSGSSSQPLQVSYYTKCLV